MASAFGSGKIPLKYTVSTVLETADPTTENCYLILKIEHLTVNTRYRTTDTGVLGTAVIQAIDQFILRHVPANYPKPSTWSKPQSNPSGEVFLVAHCLNPLYSDFYNNLREALLQHSGEHELAPFSYQLSISINFAQNTMVVEYSDSGPGFPLYRFQELAKLKEGEYFLYLNKMNLQSGGDATVQSDKYGSGPQVAGGTGRALARPAAMLSVLPRGSLLIRNDTSPEGAGARIKFVGAFRYTTDDLRNAMRLAQSKASSGMPVFIKVHEQIQSVLAKQESDERRETGARAHSESTDEGFLRLAPRVRRSQSILQVNTVSAAAAAETDTSDLSAASMASNSSSTLFSARTTASPLTGRRDPEEVEETTDDVVDPSDIRIRILRLGFCSDKQ